MAFLAEVELPGRLVALEPLSMEHADGLAEAVRDGRIHELWYTSAPAPEAVAQDIAQKLGWAAEGRMLPFAIRRLSDARLIGVTTFCNPMPALPAVEIGYTWQAASAHRTGTNTEAKLLMLTHAFDQWGCSRVCFRATWYNYPSRRAMERIGASFEGRIRKDRVLVNGDITDTAQYSITNDDWPVVQRHLKHLLLQNAQ